MGPGPSPLGETPTENLTSKKRRNIIYLTFFMRTKKNRSGILINLTAVSRRHLLYEVQSFKNNILSPSYFGYILNVFFTIGLKWI